MITIPNFATQKETFNFLMENEKSLVSQKKAITKNADGFAFVQTEDVKADFGTVDKAIQNNPVAVEGDVLKVKAVINTTNWLDSHGDVHMVGLWDKSLSENKNIMHIQEHKCGEFNKIISDGVDLKAYVQNYTWRQLGLAINGKSQALIFDSTILKKRNEYMFKQYASGYVKNHSVGMRYVKIYLCINDKDSGQYFENWNKYISEVANYETANNQGWFWAVTEAKVVEGSAVPMGSNVITPTMENNMKADPSLSESEEEPTEEVTQTEAKRRFI